MSGRRFTIRSLRPWRASREGLLSPPRFRGQPNRREHALAGPRAHANDPKVLFDRGHLRRAAAECEQRLAANAADAAAGAVLSRIRAEQGDLDGALKLATAAAAADPRNADAPYALAEIIRLLSTFRD